MSYTHASSSYMTTALQARHTPRLRSTQNWAEALKLGVDCRTEPQHTPFTTCARCLVKEKQYKCVRIQYRELKDFRFTFKPRVEEVLPQVTAKHSLLQDAPLLQLLFRWARLHECSQESNELTVLLRHYKTKINTSLSCGKDYISVSTKTNQSWQSNFKLSYYKHTL